ncbi:DUF928 domain-containing protein [Spirulina subsalsa FACHB-351]|uniref:DUF928 domain-containing protein n=1 Tax=Spirulina subsalsa FACHB-351 TaxID=234711 RepID=A0ABT3L4N6_9CYAN|nr:DUF928 domain-containing protein [Spirulina subsalsa]MCW6036464.1 DUF928 domain-containing protein [Spirulina subsalsa FACHB-351]
MRLLSSFTKTFAVLSGTFVLCVSSSLVFAQPLIWQESNYQPPSGIGSPGRTEPGGTRGCNVKPQLTPLVPTVPSSSEDEAIRFGVTTQAKPTVLIHVASLDNSLCPLGMMELEVTNQKGELILVREITPPSDSGILPVVLETGETPLVEGTNYKWTVYIYDRNNEFLGETGAWIRPVAVSPTLRTTLRNPSLHEQAREFAAAGVWYDAIAALAQLHQESPSPEVQTDWQTLLKAVQLDKLAQEKVFQRERNL